MRKEALLILFFLALSRVAVAAPPQIHQQWWMESGWFNDDTLTWVRFSADSLPAPWGASISLAENGTLTLKHHAPKGRGYCGTGLAFLQNGQFKQKHFGKKVRFQLLGNHLGMDEFYYDLTYRIDSVSEDRLVLVKTHTRVALKESYFPSDQPGIKGQLKRNSRSDARVTTV